MRRLSRQPPILTLSRNLTVECTDFKDEHESKLTYLKNVTASQIDAREEQRSNQAVDLKTVCLGIDLRKMQPSKRARPLNVSPLEKYLIGEFFILTFPVMIRGVFRFSRIS